MSNERPRLWYIIHLWELIYHLAWVFAYYVTGQSRTLDSKSASIEYKQKFPRLVFVYNRFHRGIVKAYIFGIFEQFNDEIN